MTRILQEATVKIIMHHIRDKHDKRLTTLNTNYKFYLPVVMRFITLLAISICVIMYKYGMLTEHV